MPSIAVYSHLHHVIDSDPDRLSLRRPSPKRGWVDNIRWAFDNKEEKMKIEAATQTDIRAVGASRPTDS